jgi:hypothetical protein
MPCVRERKRCRLCVARAFWLSQLHLARFEGASEVLRSSRPGAAGVASNAPYREGRLLVLGFIGCAALCDRGS